MFIRSVFGWSYPPGCNSVPGDEPQPPSCEDCPEEQYEKCPGQNKCIEVTLDCHPACCVEHKYEMADSECGECQADVWATLDLDLRTAKDRVRLLKAGFDSKRIEKLYVDAVGLKVKIVNTKELFAFVGETYHLPIGFEAEVI